MTKSEYCCDPEAGLTHSSRGFRCCLPLLSRGLPRSLLQTGQEPELRTVATDGASSVKQYSNSSTRKGVIYVIIYIEYLEVRK